MPVYWEAEAWLELSEGLLAEEAWLELSEALLSEAGGDVSVTVGERNIMGVTVPTFTADGGGEEIGRAHV